MESLRSPALNRLVVELHYNDVSELSEHLVQDVQLLSKCREAEQVLLSLPLQCIVFRPLVSETRGYREDIWETMAKYNFRALYARGLLRIECPSCE